MPEDSPVPYDKTGKVWADVFKGVLNSANVDCTTFKPKPTALVDAPLPFQRQVRPRLTAAPFGPPPPSSPTSPAVHRPIHPHPDVQTLQIEIARLETRLKQTRRYEMTLEHIIGALGQALSLARDNRNE